MSIFIEEYLKQFEYKEILANSYHVSKMPEQFDKSSILTVLKKLDSVFSGESEYDVIFMELDLHLAQIRKEFPALYVALINKKLTNVAKQGSGSDDPIEVTKELLGTMQELLNVSKRGTSTIPPLQAQEAIQQNQEPAFTEQLPIVAYTMWATDHVRPKAASAFKESDEWLVKWDIPNVPPPRVGEPLTIKNSEGYRLRFQVAEAADNGDPDGTMVYRFTFLTIVK